MFTSLPMRRVSLLVVREQAAAAALTLAKLGVFEPQIEDSVSQDLPDTPAREYRELVQRGLTWQQKILEHYDLDENLPTEVSNPPELERIRAIDAELSLIWQACSGRDEQFRRIREQTRHLRHLSASLDTFSTLDIDLAVLHRQHHFLDLRVGTLPPGNRERLSDALSLAGYRLTVFQRSEDYLNILLLGPLEHADQIRPALASAGWQALPVPEELRGHPGQVRRDLAEQLQRLEAEQQQIEQQRVQDRERLRPHLAEISHTLGLARPYASLADALRGRGGLAMVSGWVPRDEVAGLQRQLGERLKQAVFLQSRPPLPEERNQVPSAIRHPRWLQPFLTLVQNYGVPRYGEFDPTLLFALSYVAMFGMMFGDVGHGLVITAAAPLLYRRMPRIMPFIVLCGLSSALFGWLYGSIFGYEHIITPLWQSPLSDPILMLQVAMLAGIGFILLATLISIRNNLIEGDLRSALLEGNGMAGLAMYLSLLWLAWRTIEQQAAWPAATLLCISLATLMGYNAWKNRAAPLGERLLILLVEAFETVMNYVSGTLSYLRLAAFSLNHVALAIAVFTLANMLETTGYIVTVILGNVFILVLEGAIVMIQALRLQYYEGFSRFYRGDGREFQPLRLDHHTS